MQASRIIIIFVASSGFLFGQLFFGELSIPATIAGLGGVLAVTLSWLQEEGRDFKKAIIVFCVLGLVGVAMHAYQNYSDIPVYDPEWGMIGVYVLALIHVGYSTLMSSPSGE